MKTRSLFLLSTLVALPALSPATARAELPERKSPLADAPAVRHRAELRSLRLEIGPGLISTVGQDFYHAVMVGGKASFFLSDWLAIGGMVGHNLTPDMKTSFHERIEGVLPTTKAADSTDRAPTVAEAELGMNKIGQVFALQVELIPFAGKYSLFGKLFANYDFYAFGGPGFINFTGTSCTTPGASCPVTGMKVGANFGVGMHTYFTDWLSMNIEARDILLRNNPAGRDETGDKVADDDDLTWDSNYMVGVNFTFIFPGSKTSD
jgi:outer membrane beta-barrel protein